MTHPTWQAVLRSSGHPFSAELQKNRQSPVESSRGGGPLSTSLESKRSALGDRKISPILSHLLRLLLLVTLMSESPQKRQWGSWFLSRKAPLLEFWQLGKIGPSLSQALRSVGFLLRARLMSMEEPLQAVQVMQQYPSAGLSTMRGSSVPQLSAKLLGVNTMDAAVMGENLPPFSSEKVRRLAFCAEPPQNTHPSALYSQSCVRTISPFLLLVASEGGIHVGLKTCLYWELFWTRQESRGEESRWMRETVYCPQAACAVRRRQSSNNISKYGRWDINDGFTLKYQPQYHHQPFIAHFRRAIQISQLGHIYTWLYLQAYLIHDRAHPSDCQANQRTVLQSNSQCQHHQRTAHRCHLSSQWNGSQNNQAHPRRQGHH